MKKLFALLSAAMLSAVALAANTGDVNEKVLQSFRSGFPHASQVTWQELTDGYIVSFTDDRVRTKIVYNKNGVLISSTRYYTESVLPSSLRVLVKDAFPGKEIFGITEVTIATDAENHVQTVYFIKLVDKKVWMTIEMNSEGELRVTEKFRKV